MNSGSVLDLSGACLHRVQSIGSLLLMRSGRSFVSLETPNSVVTLQRSNVLTIVVSLEGVDKFEI